jgi:hypothetical protein
MRNLWCALHLQRDDVALHRHLHQATPDTDFLRSCEMARKAAWIKARRGKCHGG